MHQPFRWVTYSSTSHQKLFWEMLCRFLSRFVCSQKLRLENATMRNKKNKHNLGRKGTEKDHVIIHKQQRTTANTQSSGVFPGETAASVTTARSHASIDIDLVVLPMGGQHATPNWAGNCKLNKKKAAMELEISSFFGVQSVWSSMPCGFTLSHFQIEPLNMIDSHQIWFPECLRMFGQDRTVHNVHTSVANLAEWPYQYK